MQGTLGSAFVSIKLYAEVCESVIYLYLTLIAILVSFKNILIARFLSTLVDLKILCFGKQMQNLLYILLP